MMIFVNEFTKAEIKPKSAMEQFLLCLAPFAPHISEELWSILGHNHSIVFEEFPAYDESKTVKNEIEFVVQVSGKIRAKLQMNIDAEQSEIEKNCSSRCISSKTY